MLKLDKFESDSVAKLMQEPGGFLWWYLDLMNESGDGLVFIWFAGLPFLPDPDPTAVAASRPGLSLARYRAGRCEEYFLQEYPQQALHLGSNGRDLDLGDCRVRWHHKDSRLQLHVDLDIPIPGSSQRLRGRIETEGAATQPAIAGGNRETSHSWYPLMTATHGSAALSIGNKSIHLAGRSYVDSNASSRPLRELGIENWRWGRVAMPDREFIYYFVESDDGSPDIQLVLEVFADGSVRSHEQVKMQRKGHRRSLYGPHYSEVIELRSNNDLAVDIRLKHLVDQGPFYLRFVVEGVDRLSNQTGSGFAELVVPRQLGKAWHQPFVRMRCHQVGGANSIWLPLFCGPNGTRLRRLISHQFLGEPTPILPSAS